MSINIPTHVFIYAAGIVGVVVVVLLIAGSISMVERHIARKQIEKAARDE